MASKSDRSNYFFCVRLTNPAIRREIKDALDWMVDKEPKFADFCYTPEMIHVTLCEACLQDEEDIALAAKALKDAETILQESLPSSLLTIKGITTFNDLIMIADVEYENDFRKFAEVLKEQLKLKGVKVVERHEFRPHVTILKVNTMRARKAKVGKLNSWLYVNLKDKLFGQQSVNSVHLCKMGYERREDGFYNTPAEIIFRTNVTND
ncbi:A-kinase anchor protein 7 isoform gamma [Elysia marginata]|uniref:A-kinase anchor protein 7 isoform gamma n=1 Tax=Elysia marginata TaxID=1093978 RepID=A0AAV4IUT4_9GAST|nr:A-kinase anchor protein 7 isoform gamma [Elysia marginata]